MNVVTRLREHSGRHLTYGEEPPSMAVKSLYIGGLNAKVFCHFTNFIITIIRMWTPRQTKEAVPGNNLQKNESKMTKQQFEELFSKERSNQQILESFIVDFDLDGMEDFVILYADLEENSYSNIAIVTQTGVISEVGLDASKEFRFIEPIHADILQQGVLDRNLS